MRVVVVQQLFIDPLKFLGPHERANGKEKSTTVNYGGTLENQAVRALS